jgi:putative MATE family efflux protein
MTTPPQPPLWKAFLAFLAPLMLANILQSLSGTINNIYLGQMIGVGALAAASTFFPVLLFFISFIMGLGAGASVLVGQAYGAGKLDRAKAVAGTALSVALLGGIAVAIPGWLYAGPLLVALGTPPDILAEATSYARAMMIALPGLFAFLLATSLMRGVGDAKTPLRALAFSTAIALIATPALIRGWWGLPRLGAASAAYAALLSFPATLAWLAAHLRRRGHPLAPDSALLRGMRIDRTILRGVLGIGIPTGLQMVIMSLAEVAILGLVNRHGSAATAAYGAANQVMSYAQFPAMSVAITASVFGAQAIGAGRPDRLGAIARTGLLMNLALTGGLVALGYLLSRQIVGLFITSTPVIEMAQGLLRIVLWSVVVMGMASVLSGIMRASGTVLVPTALSIFAIAAIEVPAAYLLDHRFGLDGIWAAYPIAFAAMLILQAAYYRFVWRKKAIRSLI